MGGHDLARAFLRYQASELNRSYFDNWGAQIVLGAVLFLVLLFGSPPNRLMLLLTMLMLALVLLMHFYLTPEITRLGRVIDFVAPGRRHQTGHASGHFMARTRHASCSSSGWERCWRFCWCGGGREANS
jgi:hypothetical protein